MNHEDLIRAYGVSSDEGLAATRQYLEANPDVLARLRQQPVDMLEVNRGLDAKKKVNDLAFQGDEKAARLSSSELGVMRQLPEALGRDPTEMDPAQRREWLRAYNANRGDANLTVNEMTLRDLGRDAVKRNTSSLNPLRTVGTDAYTPEVLGQIGRGIETVSSRLGVAPESIAKPPTTGFGSFSNRWFRGANSGENIYRGHLERTAQVARKQGVDIGKTGSSAKVLDPFVRGLNQDGVLDVAKAMDTVALAHDPRVLSLAAQQLGAKDVGEFVERMNASKNATENWANFYRRVYDNYDFFSER